MVPPPERGEPSIPGGLFVFRPPRPLGSFRTMKPSRGESAGDAVTAIAVRGTAPSSNPPTKSAPSASIRRLKSSPSKWVDSGCIITGLVSKNQRDVRPLASVNASSLPPSMKASSRTSSTRRGHRAWARREEWTVIVKRSAPSEMNFPSVVAEVFLIKMRARLS